MDRDFDFLFPDAWEMHHSRLKPGTVDDWTVSRGAASLGRSGAGMGHVDFRSIPGMPDGSTAAAVTIRLFNLQAGL